MTKTIKENDDSVNSTPVAKNSFFPSHEPKFECFQEDEVKRKYKQKTKTFINKVSAKAFQVIERTSIIQKS